MFKTKKEQKQNNIIIIIAATNALVKTEPLSIVAED